MPYRSARGDWGYCVDGVGVKRPIFGTGDTGVMYPSISIQSCTVGQVLARLREQRKPSNTELYKALKASSSTYLKIERDQRDLSFVMALRLCQFYQLDLHEFISMLSDEELSRQDFSVSKALEKRERKKAEATQAKVIAMKQGAK